MKTQTKYLSILLYLFVLISFVGCKTTVKVTAKADQNAKVDVNLELGDILSQTIVSLTGLTGDSQNGSIIFNKSEMEQSLKANKFVDSVVTPVGQTGVKVESTIKKGCYEDFIKSNKEELSVTFSPESIKNLFAVMGEDYMAYADLLMAPVFTGEAMSKEEYKEILAAVYGSQLADEVTSVVIELTLIGLKGKLLSFTINIIDLLTLDAKLVYSVSNI